MYIVRSRDTRAEPTSYPLRPMSRVPCPINYCLNSLTFIDIDENEYVESIHHMYTSNRSIYITLYTYTHIYNIISHNYYICLLSVRAPKH